MQMAESGGSPKTILIVDDEASVRRLLREILVDAGYAVCEAGNGKEALDVLVSCTADLVITDLVMPEQEGIETIRTIRKQHPKLGIIAVSGAFQGRFLRGAELLGADAALMKPIAPETLLDTVRRVLEQKAG